MLIYRTNVENGSVVNGYRQSYMIAFGSGSKCTTLATLFSRIAKKNHNQSSLPMCYLTLALFIMYLMQLPCWMQIGHH